MNGMTIFEMKEKMATLQASINADAQFLAEKASDPTVSMEDLNAKKAHMEDTQSRFDMIKAQCDRAEAEQKAAIEAQSREKSGSTSADNRVRAKAALFRALAGKDQASIEKAYTHLGAIPAADADLGNGSKLLPTNLQNELIVEPREMNPMRDIVRMSNIRGLEEPKLILDLGNGYDDITDKQTAQEIKLEGDSIVYGRHKVKPVAKISETVLHGTDVNLVSEVESALRDGLAINEINRMFAASPATDYAGMSFYSTANAIKAVTGTSKQEAIAKALADLPLSFRRNAKIVMSAADWFEMWGKNLNQSGMYFENRPQQLFGKEVVLVDDATIPVIGDFSYCRINYDIDTILDVDKDVDTGIYKYVLTAWYDIKIRLKSAFRLAKVGE